MAENPLSGSAARPRPMARPFAGSRTGQPSPVNQRPIQPAVIPPFGKPARSTPGASVAALATAPRTEAIIAESAEQDLTSPAAQVILSPSGEDHSSSAHVVDDWFSQPADTDAYSALQRERTADGSTVDATESRAEASPESWFEGSQKAESSTEIRESDAEGNALLGQWPESRSAPEAPQSDVARSDEAFVFAEQHVVDREESGHRSAAAMTDASSDAGEWSEDTHSSVVAGSLPALIEEAGSGRPEEPTFSETLDKDADSNFSTPEVEASAVEPSEAFESESYAAFDRNHTEEAPANLSSGPTEQETITEPPRFWLASHESRTENAETAGDSQVWGEAELEERQSVDAIQTSFDIPQFVAEPEPVDWQSANAIQTSDDVSQPVPVEWQSADAIQASDEVSQPVAKPEPVEWQSTDAIQTSVDDSQAVDEPVSAGWRAESAFQRSGVDASEWNVASGQALDEITDSDAEDAAGSANGDSGESAADAEEQFDHVATTEPAALISADLSQAVSDPALDRVAGTLERLAARIRNGEIQLSQNANSGSETAMLASVLTTLLTDSP